MSDTVKVVMEQIDDDSKEAISRVTVEWFGSDRNIANALSTELIQGMIDRVKGMAAQKVEVTGSDEIKAVLGVSQAKGNPGAIR